MSRFVQDVFLAEVMLTQIRRDTGKRTSKEQKNEKIKKKAHLSAGSLQREKHQLKLGSKCLNTSLLNEDKS
ncbi:hypothetical protein E2C01_051766 [Portunus trituberculatus]|uniref:Uncharacterized protein n=1 Tax=Portunus trituberculatus TaxID=210409 RepID=A0A5B7GLC7_PORTR|nr:hypothetical protein [Portunus trituberculatus]